MTIAHIRSTCLPIALALALAGCGGGDSPTGPGGNAGISAQINGSSWAGEAFISNATLNVEEDILLLYGLDTDGYSLSINLAEVSSTGTYAMTSTFPLRFAVVTAVGGGSWGTTYTGGSGSVTVSSLTQDRVAGTFQFTAPAAPGSSQTGTLTVTQGQFDLNLIRLQ